MLCNWLFYSWIFVSNYASTSSCSFFYFTLCFVTLYCWTFLNFWLSRQSLPNLYWFRSSRIWYCRYYSSCTSRDDWCGSSRRIWYSTSYRVIRLIKWNASYSEENLWQGLDYVQFSFCYWMFNCTYYRWWSQWCLQFQINFRHYGLCCMPSFCCLFDCRDMPSQRSQSRTKFYWRSVWA